MPRLFPAVPNRTIHPQSGRSVSSGLLFALAAGLISLTRVTAETSTEVNGFSGSAFTLARDGTFTEGRTSPLGAYSFNAYSLTGGVSRSSGKVTLTPTPQDQYASATFGHTFAQPVDLSTLDYIGIDLTHTGTANPVQWIILYLEGGNSLELKNTTLNPFLTNQKKFPFYQMVAPSGSFRLHPESVTGLHVQILAQSGPVAVDAIRVASLAPRTPLSLGMTVGGTREVVVTTSRAIGQNEVFRLEASNNLVNWFDKQAITRGTGQPPVFEKYFQDGKFYRVSYYNYVDVSAP